MASVVTSTQYCSIHPRHGGVGGTRGERPARRITGRALTAAPPSKTWAADSALTEPLKTSGHMIGPSPPVATWATLGSPSQILTPCRVTLSGVVFSLESLLVRSGRVGPLTGPLTRSAASRSRWAPPPLHEPGSGMTRMDRKRSRRRQRRRRRRRRGRRRL